MGPLNGGENAKHTFALTCLKSVPCKIRISQQLSTKLIKIHKCWQFETCLSPANFVNYIMFSFFKCSGRIFFYWFSNICILSLELIDPFWDCSTEKKPGVKYTVFVFNSKNAWQMLGSVKGYFCFYAAALSEIRTSEAETGRKNKTAELQARWN